MKSRAILLALGLLISSSFAFGQAPKDPLQKDSIHQRIIVRRSSIVAHLLKDSVKVDSIRSKIYRVFLTDSAWQIQKEAFKKQLESMGLSEKEINQKVQEFEKQKPALMERIKVEMKMVGKQLQLSEIQRKMAEKQMEEVNKKLNSPEFKKRMEEVNKRLNSPEFQKKMAEVQQKMAEVQRKLAEKQAKMAEAWKKSVKNLVHKNIILSGNDSKNRIVKIKVIHENTLFFNINCTINSGSVLIEVFDPKGQKEGELSLEHREKSAAKKGTRISGSTSGSLNKIINAPEKGEWEVKVKPKKSNGHIYISIGQLNQPAI